ncbi:MAG TPA: glycosyltransferase [Rhodocyclaceae bacterium]|nr:glycosyltransferase [Rhodocyclaceae bacterium]
MRILVVTDNRFWRQALGSHQRIYQLLKFMHGQGHALEVMFVGAPTAEDDESMRQLDFVHIETTQPVMVDAVSAAEERRSSRLKRIARECLHRLRRMPCQVAYGLRTGRFNTSSNFALSMQEPKLRDFIRPAAIAKLNRRLAERLPDVLIVEYLRLTYLVDAIPATIRARLNVLLDTHDVLFERRNRFHQAGLPHDVDITPAEEAMALNEYDTIIAIQTRDAEIFRALAPERTVIVVGHGMRNTTTARPELAAPRFLFLGSDMKPNLDAARRLAFDIWPEINQRLEGKAQLTIVGKVSAALVEHDLASNIRLEGHVASLNEIYLAHNIFLNPVDFGGGLKIKNVEALTHGMALITTPIGAEGLEAGTGTAFLVANSNREFVDAAYRVATDRALQVSLSEAAFDFANKYLGPESTYGELLRHLYRPTPAT